MLNSNGTIRYIAGHLLKAEGEDGWEEKRLNALPYISINGADSGNTRKKSHSFVGLLREVPKARAGLYPSF